MTELSGFETVNPTPLYGDLKVVGDEPSDWDDISNKPAFIAAGTTAENARDVIDAAAGADNVMFATGTVRPTNRTDVCVIWIGTTDPGSAAIDDVDIWLGAL